MSKWFSFDQVIYNDLGHFLEQFTRFSTEYLSLVVTNFLFQMNWKVDPYLVLNYNYSSPQHACLDLLLVVSLLKYYEMEQLRDLGAMWSNTERWKSRFWENLHCRREQFCIPLLDLQTNIKCSKDTSEERYDFLGMIILSK